MYRVKMALAGFAFAALLLFGFGIDAEAQDRQGAPDVLHQPPPITLGSYVDWAHASHYAPLPNAVRLDQVPQFRNENISFQPTNGLIAGVVRRNIQQAMNRQHPPLETATVASQRELQWSNNLIREIMEVWEKDPASQVFGVNADGMKVQLDQVMMRLVTRAPGEPLGIWYFDTREGRVVTHTMEGRQRSPRDIDDIAAVFLYELFGRGEGMGVNLSSLKAEHILGTDTFTAHGAYDWFHYTGFYRGLGASAGGIEYVFAEARKGADSFQAWADSQITIMNRNFTFTYDQMQAAIAGAGNIIRDGDAMTVFARITDMTEHQVWVYFRNAWAVFYTAINPDATPSQRNRAARQFSDTVIRIAETSLYHELWLWIADDYGRSISILDWCKPYIDLDNPQNGVFSQWMMGQPQVRRPGAIFPEVPEMLAGLEPPPRASARR